MIKTALIVVSILITSFQVQAGVWEEREFIERYVEQVEVLNETLLLKAQQAANPNDRIQLDYEQVRQNSEEMLNKLKQYLYAPMEPYRPQDIQDASTEEQSE